MSSSSDMRADLETRGHGLVYKALKFGSNNEFLGSHDLVAADDDDAIILAELVAAAECKVDVWDGSRFVECIEP